MKIAFVTTCKGRVEHLKKTLPQSLADNASYADCIFVLLDYNDGDGLADYIKANFQRELQTGRLVYYQYRVNTPFRMSHSKNMVARLAMLESADVLVTLDADNYTGRNFAHFVAGMIYEPGVFLCPDFPRIKSLPHGPLRPQRGYAGRLAIRAQDFIKAGGYDENFDTWRGEDIDLIARLKRMEFTMRLIDNRFLNAIPHTAEVRFKEYPHAQAYEREGEWKAITNRTETVVNFGNIGCGTVYRNYDDTPIVVSPVPTRVFGIGMHKTATSSLHEAFKTLGYDSFHWDNNRKAWRIWNEMNGLGRSTMLERSYCLSDNPIPMLYQHLDRAYPGSKFILTIRSEEGWLKSVQGLWDPKINPYYDWDIQPFSHRIHEALYGCRDFDAPTFLARYRRHNAEVLEYFKDRPDDLLVMDMSNGAGWEELCGFLKQPIPNVDYPVKLVSNRVP